MSQKDYDRGYWHGTLAVIALSMAIVVCNGIVQAILEAYYK